MYKDGVFLANRCQKSWADAQRVCLGEAQTTNNFHSYYLLFTKTHKRHCCLCSNTNIIDFHHKSNTLGYDVSRWQTAETEQLVWAQWCFPDSPQYAGTQRQFGSWRNPVEASEKFHDISRLAAGETSAIWFHVDCFDNAILCHQCKSETMRMDQSKLIGKQKFSRMGNTCKAICWHTPGLQPQENGDSSRCSAKGTLLSVYSTAG